MTRQTWLLAVLGAATLLAIWLLVGMRRATGAPSAGSGLRAPGSGSRSVQTRSPEPGARSVYLPGFEVGEFFEPPHAIRTTMDDKKTVRLRGFWTRQEIEVLVEALRLVNPNAKQTNRGRLVGAIALRLGIQGMPNRRFYYRPRIACAAFVSYVMKRAGERRGFSFAVNTFYPQIRKRGGVLVASRVSTRYAPFYRYLRQGDLVFYHYPGRARMGHMEIFVGGGKTVGTSSSALRLGVRRIGNRGYAVMSIIRP